MKRNALRAGFTRNEVFCITGLVLAIVMGTLTWGYRISEREQVLAFTNQSQQLNNEAGLHIAETRSFIKSIEAMHYASQDFAGPDIEAFVKQVSQYSPYLHSMGMFQEVFEPMRERYQQQMMDKNGDAFSIHHYSATGARIPVDPQERILPIHSVTSLEDSHESMLGADLAGSRDIEDMLDSAIETGESFIVQAPDGWPFHASYLLIQPLYLGRQVPETTMERRQLFAGGIWVSLDPEEMMYHQEGEALPGTMSVTISSGQYLSKIMVSTTPASSQPGMEAGFATLKSERSWLMGSSSLQLSWVVQPLMPLFHWVRTVAVLLVLLVAVIAGSLIIYSRRQAQLELFSSLRVLNAEREKAELTLTSISDAVISLDSSRYIVYMNASAARLLDTSGVAEMNKPIEYYLMMADSKGDEALFPGFEMALAALPSQGKAEYDVALRLPKLNEVAVKLTLTGMSNADGAQQGSIVVMKDVSNERKLTSELEYRANYDYLTGAINRFHFEKRLRSLLDATVDTDRRHALCFFDLDNFKIVNDTCGHAAGDSLLCEVTAELQKNLRTGDMLSRLGGDEFGAVICDCDATKALVIANKIHEFFSHYVFESEGSAFSVSASIGFVAIDRDFCDYMTIMSSADSACYAAKESGRNALVVFSDDDEDVSERAEETNWQSKLQSALEQGSFRLLVQAIAVLENDTLKPAARHYEFLLRLVDSTKKEISPYKFIKAAERYDLMAQIDRWVLENAFMQIGKLLKQLDEPCTFSINLSGQSLSDPQLLNHISTLFSKHGVNPECVWFEITETAAISQYSTASILLQGLRDKGAKVALDDFGSGLSSFVYLQKLPVDILKIDGQFVKEMDTNPVARQMVTAIDQMAKALGLTTVAEFVESAAVVEALTEIGVDYAQGYHIAMPCGIEAILADSTARHAA